MKLFKTLWGVVDALDDKLLKRIKADGFDGIEICATVSLCPFKDDAAASTAFRSLLTDNGLLVIAQIHTMDIPVRSSSVADHLAHFKELLVLAMKWQPIVINCHSGRDAWTVAQCATFFAEAEKIVAELAVPVPVCHETHRSRIFYSPFRYYELMQAGSLPATLKVTADLSHWCVVAERCFDDALDADFWPAVLADVAKRCTLIHARVGAGQTPQIMDPEDVQANGADVAAHFKWWKAIAVTMKAHGRELIIEPEHGGDPYLHRLPYTHQPIYDVWSVNTKLGKRIRSEFARF